MPKLSENEYDAIIIGAGISGLICGCYLAKAGMKVLIVEQHFKPGGYCTSFKRGKYTFDAAAHCFGSYRENGITKKIFKELSISNKLNIIRADPSDTVLTPDYNISFWNNLEKTITEIQELFSGEAGRVRDFFNLLLNADPSSFSQLRKLTFKSLLDKHFNDDKLKAILAFPFLGIGGLPASMMSAFVGAKLFSEFLIDGGYYPVGGMQAIPEALEERFKEFGGVLLSSTLVKKIKVDNNAVSGVVLGDSSFVSAKYVISSGDARQTFIRLLGKGNITEDFRQTIKTMMPSISNFILYLGLDRYFEQLPRPGTSMWVLRHYDLERTFKSAEKRNFDNNGGYMFRVSSSNSALALMPARYKSKKFWERYKSAYLEDFIHNIEDSLLPNLSSHIAYKEAATPHTLNRYTLNYKGASFGWASIPTQLTLPNLRKPSFIQGLYLTGHWTTLGVGVSGVAYVGYDTAKIILRKESM